MSVGMQAAATGAVGANPISTPHARGRAAMQSWGEEAADRASAAGESADARFVQQPDGSVLLAVLVPPDKTEGGGRDAALEALEALLRLRDSLTAAGLLHGLVANDVRSHMRAVFALKSLFTLRRFHCALAVDTLYWIAQYVILALAAYQPAGERRESDRAVFYSGEQLVYLGAALAAAALCALGCWAVRTRSLLTLRLYVAAAAVSVIFMGRATRLQWLYLVTRGLAVICAYWCHAAFTREQLSARAFQRARALNAALLAELAAYVERMTSVAVAAAAAAGAGAGAPSASDSTGLGPSLSPPPPPPLAGGDAAAGPPPSGSSGSDGNLDAALAAVSARLAGFRPVDYTPFMSLDPPLGLPVSPHQQHLLLLDLEEARGGGEAAATAAAASAAGGGSPDAHRRRWHRLPSVRAAASRRGAVVRSVPGGSGGVVLVAAPSQREGAFAGGSGGGGGGGGSGASEGAQQQQQQQQQQYERLERGEAAGGGYAAVANPLRAAIGGADANPLRAAAAAAAAAAVPGWHPREPPRGGGGGGWGPSPPPLAPPPPPGVARGGGIRVVRSLG